MAKKRTAKKWAISISLISFMMVGPIWGYALARPEPVISQNGLSQNEVRCMLQDGDGFMWIGTQDGLNRYDGYEFKRFRKDPFNANSLCFDIINVLAEDNHRLLWIGTLDGLDVYDPVEETFVHLDHLLPDELGRCHITAIRPMGMGMVVTTLQHVYMFHTEGSKDVTQWHSEKISLDKDGLTIFDALVLDQQLMLGTTEGLLAIDRITGDQFFLKPSSPTAFTPHHLLVDRFGHLIMLSGGKVFVYFPEKAEWQEAPFQVDKASALLADRKSALWIGTRGMGVFTVPIAESGLIPGQMESVSHTDQEYTNEAISVLYEGREVEEDLIWCGTGSRGLFHFSRSKNSFRPLHAGLKKQFEQSNAYYALYAGDTSLLVGSDGGLFEINLADLSAKKILVDKKIEAANQLQEIYQDCKGNLWFGSNAGLYQRATGEEKIQKYKLPPHPGRSAEPAILSATEDKQGKLWIGTTTGLVSISEGQSEAFDTIACEGKSSAIGAIGALVCDRLDRLWIGSVNGLFMMEKDQFTCFRYDPLQRTGLIENIINDIHESRTGDIWIATSKGLSKVWENKQRLCFIHYTEKEGLHNSFIYGILEDQKGLLWLSTNEGLSSFDPQTEAFTNYGSQDGLIRDEFNSGAFATGPDGSLYFGGLGLLVSFRPDQIRTNQHRPKIQSVKITIDEKPVRWSSSAGPLKISPDYNVLKIQVAALDFTNPGKNQYAYRIKDIHADWISNGTQRVINLFNLPYGRLQLEVKASNNQGVWQEVDVLKIELELIPPFWRTNWFYALAVLGVLALFYGIHRHVVQHKLEIERVRLEENERVRKMASQDMHDEFGNTLTRISVLTEVIKSKLRQNKSQDIAAQLDKIADNSARLYQGTKDFIWSIKMDSDQLFETIIRIKDFAEESMNTKGISFNCSEINPELKNFLLPPASSRHVVMIMKEAISNSLKHSGASCTYLCIKVEKSSCLQLQWKDNGQGWDQTGNRGNGIDKETVKSHIKNIYIKLEVHSKADALERAKREKWI